MNRLSRATALKIGAAISFVMGLYYFFSAIPYLIQGYVEPMPGVNQIPQSVIISAFVFAILRIIGAFGAWRQQRWGIVLTLLANAIDLVLGLPGLLFAPTMELLVSTIVGVITDVAVIVLCLWRDRRPVTP